jgi:Uma2 family endonuclease
MVSQLTISSTEVIYPESDGQPMASNTTHFIWIVTIKENLDWFFSQNQNSDLKIFVAGDLLWYPIQGRNDLSTAPDIMVAIGRPRGHRGSYKQWLEDNIAPQVAFEILSPSNTKEEMDKKLLFYDRYGVQEYYIYDYEANRLLVWLRQGDSLSPLVIVRGWQSPRLGIQFEITDETLKMFHADGTPFLNYAEIQDLLAKERQRADTEKQRADLLAAKLRELGIEP